MECQIEKNEHFRHILLFEFNAETFALSMGMIHLLRELHSSLSHSELKNWLTDFFESKPEEFFKRGIFKLPDRWEAVVNSEGEYIID